MYLGVPLGEAIGGLACGRFKSVINFFEGMQAICLSKISDCSSFVACGHSLELRGDPFLFALPAGALANMVDRKKFLCLVNLWLAAAAAGQAILGWLHLLNPYVIPAGAHRI